MLVMLLSIVLLLTNPATAGQGWYFLLPPADRVFPALGARPGSTFSEMATKLMKEIPLSEWVVYRAFDTARECEAERDARSGWWSRESSRAVTGPSRDLKAAAVAAEQMTYWGMARCVASDDPRLRR
ncbi:MAG: hypothetical protein Q8Q29_09595 [Actinomycetota bacterium]|nr:hypothetical protein [Actinomycetota bacterium]